MFGEGRQTTNPKAASSGHVETNTDIHKVKELSTNFNYGLLYTDICLLNSHIFVIRI